MQSTVAQTPSGSGEASLLLWTAILVGVVMLLSAVIMVLRRKMLSGEDAAVGHAGLLSQLRAMHDEGRLSDEEFAAAKARLARATGAGMKSAATKGTGATGPNAPRTRPSR
ncbi:MAG: hypothetical protein ACKVS8_03100 [Phycisphaerales bacterium]